MCIGRRRLFFLGLPQKFIPSPPPEDAFPKKAKIGFSTGEKTH